MFEKFIESLLAQIGTLADISKNVTEMTDIEIRAIIDGIGGVPVPEDFTRGELMALMAGFNVGCVACVKKIDDEVNSLYEEILKKDQKEG